MVSIISDPKLIDEILNRGTIVEILPSKTEFRNRLLSGKKLKFYIGFDPTSATLHLSHAKNFILLEKFRQLGHEVIILFGDFTARIGDPTGESVSRKQLSRQDVIKNVRQWQKLIKPLFNFEDKHNPPKIMYNHQWLSKLKLEELIDLASNFTVQQMIVRDMFQRRLEEDKPIYLHEFLYPLMQGFDSVMMDVDVEMCGTDQIFNALAGRTLLKKLTGKDKYIVAVTLMENPKTGELMSKSKGIGVFLNVSAKEMYGQIMAQPDEMVKILFVNNTHLPLNEIDKLLESNQPRDTKMRLAFEITKIFHGDKVAKEAEQAFVTQFQKKEIPKNLPTIKLNKYSNNIYSVIDILTLIKFASSKSESKRLIEQKAVHIDGALIEDIQSEITLYSGMVIKVGKRKIVKIKLV